MATMVRVRVRPHSSVAHNSPLAEQFRAFAKFGDSKADGKAITLSQSDNWMKQAKVIDGTRITTTDTGIYFKKFRSLKLSLIDYHKFLEELAKAKKVDMAEIRDKMIHCGPPSTAGTTATVRNPVVGRLTNSAKPASSSHTKTRSADEKGPGPNLHQGVANKGH